MIQAKKKGLHFKIINKGFKLIKLLPFDSTTENALKELCKLDIDDQLEFIQAIEFMSILMNSVSKHSFPFYSK